MRSSQIIARAAIRIVALPDAASLYRQNVQCHLQLRDRRTDFWMLSEFLLQGFQNLVSPGNVRCSLSWILLGIGFAVRFHGQVSLYVSCLIIFHLFIYCTHSNAA